MGAEPHAVEGGVAPVDVGGFAPTRTAAPAESREQAKTAGSDAQPLPAYAQPPSGQQAPPPMHGHLDGQTSPPAYGQLTYGQPVYGQVPPGVAYVSSPEPIPGFPIRPPLSSPLPGQVIVGYQVVEPPNSGCHVDLKLEGWLVVLILLLLFWPLAWIPCCLPECFQRYQIPVYGYPGQTIPVAHPQY